MAVSALRTVLIYLIVIVAMRIMGKRQLGDMRPAELVVTLMIADVVSVPLQDTGIPLLAGVTPLVILVAMELLLSGLMLKSPLFQRLICGKPVVVVQDGVLHQQELRRLRMTVEDLYVAMRAQAIFDITQIAYAVAETNGQVSFLLKPDNLPATAADAGATPEDNGIPAVVISDGKISPEALTLCGLTPQWLHDILRKEHCEPKEIFLMAANKARKYTIIRRTSSG